MAAKTDHSTESTPLLRFVLDFTQMHITYSVIKLLNTPRDVSQAKNVAKKLAAHLRLNSSSIDSLKLDAGKHESMTLQAGRDLSRL